MRRWRRALAWLAGTLACVLVVAMAAVILLLRGSLPALDGERALPGLTAPVTIRRDGAGVPTLVAGSRTDLARALGWLHAQERYLDMDLARRIAAGELAALVGRAALPMDRQHRLHRFRARARAWLASLPEAERVQLEAFADGANAGLAALRVRPWPYLLLRQTPQPWQAEDTLLVVLAMFFDLQDASNRREYQLDLARRHLPPEVFAFIVRPGTRWDAPLQGGPLADPPLPGPESLDLRLLPPVEETLAMVDAGQALLPGSNSFAVAAPLTPDGRALVANDMHLGLRAPNIWYRLAFEYRDAEAGTVRAAGLSLPGVPALVTGSNGYVAWAFTNSYGDWLDLVRVHPVGDGRRYDTAAGPRPFDLHEEVIPVAGGGSETLTVRDTVWGPVIGGEDGGALLALAWTAHRDGAVNTALMALERATGIDAALDIATRAGIPAQNFLVGDARGRIGWTIAGRIPRRLPGFDPAHVIDGAALDGDLWQGWVAPDGAPRIVDPPSGRLWTANARVASGDALALTGDGGYDLGARAAQIRDGLLARGTFTEADLLAIQLDDRALFLEPWWRLLREVLQSAAGEPRLRDLEAATTHWEGCACVDAVAYRLVRAFRNHVHGRVMRGLAAPVREHIPDFTWPRLGQAEGVVWQLVQERPAHLLPPPHADWEELLRAAALDVAEALTGGPGAQTWGEANRVRIRHPLSAALPGWLAGFLDRPVQPLPGDANMPRVQSVAFGASQRSVISPGAEDRAIAHTPAGQSGHPLSPYYAAGHEDWAQGRPSPLLPGEPQWILVLRPAPEAATR